MTTLDIHIWQTEELTEYCKNNYSEDYRAAKIAKTYIEGAFSQSGGYSADVDTKTTTPFPKVQGPAGKSFEQTATCDSSETIYYDSVLDYWSYQLNYSCWDYERAQHVDLLLTKYDSSGLATSGEAVAAVGEHIADNAPESYEKFGKRSENDGVFNKLDTVLEEVGHALKAQGSCSDRFADDNDNDGSSHDSGVVDYNSSGDYYAITPIGITGDTCSNDCQGTSAETDYCKGRTDTDGDGKPDAWAMYYSQCTECFFP